MVITLVFSALAAWGLSRWQFVGRDMLLSLIISLMVIPPVVLVVPLFLLGAELNLIDTRRIVIVIYVGLMMPFSVYMLASYFRTMPRSLIEAAEIDGAGSIQVFLARRRCRCPAPRWSRSPSSTCCGSGTSC